MTVDVFKTREDTSAIVETANDFIGRDGQI